MPTLFASHVFSSDKETFLELVKNAGQRYTNGSQELITALDADETIAPSLKEIYLTGKELSYSDRVLSAFESYKHYNVSPKAKTFFADILVSLATQEPREFSYIQTSSYMSIMETLGDDQSLVNRILKKQIQATNDFDSKIRLANQLTYQLAYPEGTDSKIAKFLFKLYYELKQAHPEFHGNGYQVDEFGNKIFNYQNQVSDLKFEKMVFKTSDFRKLAQFCIHALKRKIPFYQDYFNKLMELRKNEFIAYAKTTLQKLPSFLKSGIQPLHEKRYYGEGVSIAVCDVGFSQALKTERGTSLSDNEFIFLWDLMQEDVKAISEKHQYGNKDFVSSQDYYTKDHLSNHGSTMISHVHTVAPKARIVPIEFDETSASWIDCFNALAIDESIHVINVSWPLPGMSTEGEGRFLVDPILKHSLINCLRNGKIILLAAGNINKRIPVKAGMEEDTIMEVSSEISPNDFWVSYYNVNQKIGHLFENEPSDSPLFSNLLIVGSSKANSLSVHEESVKPGHGPAQKQYVYVDGDKVHPFFKDSFNGGAGLEWGGTSSATAAASGIIASLWNAVGLDTPASNIITAALNTCDKVTDFEPAIHGQGKLNPENAFKFLRS